MKTLCVLIGGAIVAVLGVLLWQSSYQYRMLRHLQLSLAWDDRRNLQYPTQRSYFMSQEKAVSKESMRRMQKGMTP